jgi:N-acetylneuraminic acid mutarotase
MSWTDSDGSLFLFGGEGYDGGGTEGSLNDLWGYDPSMNMWTWLKGPDTKDQSGICDIYGAPGAANNPGARYGAISWSDGNGTLYLFGGYGYDCGNYRTNLGDVWQCSSFQWSGIVIY